MNKVQWKAYLKNTSDWIDKYIGRLSGAIFSLLIIPLIGIVCYEVFSRYVLSSPTGWAYDIVYMLYGSYFMLGIAYTLFKQNHIRTDVFYDKYSIRQKGLVNTVMYLFFFFPGMSIFMIVGWKTAYEAWLIKETSPFSTWGAPIYLYKMVIPISTALILIQGVSELIKSSYAGWVGEEL